MNNKLHSLVLTGLVLGSAILLNSCAKDDPFHTSHPDEGALKVTTDWSSRSSDATMPSTYVLRIGSEEQTVQGETNTLKSLFSPGILTVFVYNQTEGITINGNTATVNTLADGTLNPSPGFLFSAVKDVNILPDDTVHATIQMRQHIRTLQLVLSLSAGDERRIEGTSAVLTGIASTIELTNGTLNMTDIKQIIPAFTLMSTATSRAETRPALSATICILGVATAEKQQLTVNVMMTNGTTETVSSDITDALKNFSVGTLDPLILNATLTLSSDAGIHAGIHDWTVVDNGDVNLH